MPPSTPRLAPSLASSPITPGSNLKEIEKIGRVSSVSVEKHTQKSWSKWVELLDRAGAKNWNHQELVAHLVKKYELSLWWRQIVSIGYETHTGKRILGQDLKGEYSTASTRTLPIAASEAWKWIWSKPIASKWFPTLEPLVLKKGSVFETPFGFYGQIRTMQAGKKVRMTWTESTWSRPTFLEVQVVPRGPKKCTFVIQSMAIKTAETHAQLRAHWKQRVALLSEAAPKTKKKNASR